MDSLLRQVNEVWGLHDPSHTLGNPPADGVGCLAFVVDDRHVVADFDPDVKLRLAATFGENTYPDTRERGRVGPSPLPGKFRSAIHEIGIRGKRITVFDRWSLDFPAGDCQTAQDGERRAGELLAEISDEEFASRMGSRRGPMPVVMRSGPVDLVGLVLVDNEERL